MCVDEQQQGDGHGQADAGEQAGGVEADQQPADAAAPGKHGDPRDSGDARGGGGVVAAIHQHGDEAGKGASACDGDQEEDAAHQQEGTGPDQGHQVDPLANTRRERQAGVARGEQRGGHGDHQRRHPQSGVGRAPAEVPDKRLAERGQDGGPETDAHQREAQREAEVALERANQHG